MEEYEYLYDMKLKPGDVVELPPDGYSATARRYAIGENPYKNQGEVSLTSGGFLDSNRKAKLVKLYKRWEQLSPEEKGALLLAYHEGKTIELLALSGNWEMISDPVWCYDIVYRVKPEPIVETHNHFVIAHGETRKTEFNVVEGKVDWNSFRILDE